MIGWLVYAVQVGLCVAALAWATESVTRLLRRPTRFIWFGAVIFSTTLMVRAAVVSPEPPAAAQPLSLSSLDILQASVLSAQQRVPAVPTEYIAVIWALATLLVGSSFAATGWKLRRASRGWPTADLHGHRVRVAPSTGPLVLGLIHPEIVVPRWVLTRPPAEQNVILTHEIEHLNAGDQNLLALGCLAGALMPWNPACWIMVARLRLAIEIDCDARVLRAGVSPRCYGSLLVDVAESSSPFLLGTMGLAARPSHLRSRILAMQSRRFNRPFLRGTAAALVGLVSFLGACESRMPTAADIARMDAASVERAAPKIGLPQDSLTAWVVNGTPSTAAAAKQIPAESIASVRLSKENGRSQVRIVTKEGQRLGADTARVTRVVTPSHEPVMRTGVKIAPTALTAQPLVIVDGLPSTTAALGKLSVDRIASVEVVKGESALAQYGESGRNGVILVTTKNP
jgi:TonB-dependent SusC/RagA subfamily outer membrane receptor